jgi:hypothetical protein
MPFTLPQFNCTFDSYRLDTVTLLWHRVLTGTPCQWYVNPRFQVMTEPPDGGSEEFILHFLRVPMGTDIAESDIVNVEPGEDFWYQLIETERVHKNFPNEYWVGFASNIDQVSLPFGVIYDEDGIQLQTETLVPITTEI